MDQDDGLDVEQLAAVAASTLLSGLATAHAAMVRRLLRKRRRTRRTRAHLGPIAALGGSNSSVATATSLDK